MGRLIAGRDYKEGDFLIVGSPDPRSWLLQVAIDGALQPALMEGAFQALTVGLNGIRYVGLDAADAMQRLLVLYREQDLPVPAVPSEVIKQEGGKWLLYSKDGSKVLGTFDSEE